MHIDKQGGDYMAVYQCIACGHLYDEGKEGVLFEDLPDDWTCPICGVPKAMFKKVEEKRETIHKETKKTETREDKEDLSIEKTYAKVDSEHEPYMSYIQEVAVKGNSVIEAMGTKLPVISWNDILFLGAQLFATPLEKHEKVTTRTVIGKRAKHPMVLESPIYISHMSFGALSKEAKMAMAKGSAMAKTAMCSGEGGILPEEKQASYQYIFEYVPNEYSVSDENLREASAIEIKIGQGTKPGMGGHLPGEKVTEEIAKIRNKKVGEDIISPSHFANITSKEALKELVDHLRKRSEGKPIGIKIAAGHIEKDMEIIAYAKPDFVTIDGRGGATGASPKMLKDSSSVPTIYALYRAKKYIVENDLDIDLVITGGLRVSSDFAKALAMGADAIAIATSAMIAVGCQQYRICHNGKCPMGIATQEETLRSRLSIEKASKRVYQFLQVSNEELKMFARITGKRDVHDLSVEDLCTTNSEISNYTNICHV